MKLVRQFFLAVFLALLASARGSAAPDQYGEMASVVAQVLEQNHYTHRTIDTPFSRLLCADFIEELDPDRLYFTRADFNRIMEDQGSALGSEILAGRLDAAFAIFDFYRDSVEKRTIQISELIRTSAFEFTSDRSVESDRTHSPWPANAKDADRLWRDRIDGELLDEKLDGKSMAQAVETVSGRYIQARDEVRQETRLDAVSSLLAALTHTYDPHSDFLTGDEVEEMNSDMRLSMVGIGVVLEPDGRYVQVTKVIPGSPAEKGALKIHDRIVAVAQREGPFVDVAGLRYNRVLDLIHGRSGTPIRLELLDPNGADAAQRRTVQLVRRKIELSDEEASAEMIDHIQPDGRHETLGWITLPSFYGDPTSPEDRSASHDVRRLLKRLDQEKISGLVIDLRGNPGGELDEAVNLGGYFLGKEPIVQEKDTAGKLFVSKAAGRRLYAGPMVVLTDHLTASAAELFASALQDYGRAVIVGGSSPTFGKGSVQTIVDLDEILPHRRAVKKWPEGALQVTIAKFYRVNGHSVQLRGLTPDIQIPSPEDLPDEGETTMKNTLDYDELTPVSLGALSSPKPLPLMQLRDRSAPRVAADPEFRYLRDDLERERKTLEANSISLNESVRRAELFADKARSEQRTAQRSQRKTLPDKIVRITLADAEAVPSKTESRPAASAAPSSESAAVSPDPVRNEALNILSDLAGQRIQEIARTKR